MVKRKVANCPACGGPVTFRIPSSIVAVCEFCKSVVARGDKRLEDLGKVADIVDTSSPLKLGLKGVYEGKSFLLVGRVQYQHAAGGTWDEWYAAFPGNRWGWLAEAQGRRFLTFRAKSRGETKLPTLAAISAGESITLKGIGEFVVGEVGEASILGAAGEIPYRVVPGAPHPFADLYGPDDAFATIDGSDEEAAFYLGKEVSLRDLGIRVPSEGELAKSARGQQPDPSQKVGALQLNCPQCGGPLVLRAPDHTQRVTCPSCNSLLDVESGNLRYLKSLEVTKGREPLIPLGSVGVFEGTRYETIGFMERYVEFEGKRFSWQEYLLFEPHAGFRWLVYGDGHWSFVRPLSPGAVKKEARKAVVTENGESKTFKIFQKGKAIVSFVLGEFYWKIEVNEQAYTTDYIAPPFILSVEKYGSEKRDDGTTWQKEGATGEVQFSLGKYVSHADLEKIFGLPQLPRQWSVAPNQPTPVDRNVYWFAAMFCGLLFLAYMILSSLKQDPSGDMLSLIIWGILLVIVPPIGLAIYDVAFESSRWQNADYDQAGNRR